jgi:hypothetical protein
MLCRISQKLFGTEFFIWWNPDLPTGRLTEIRYSELKQNPLKTVSGDQGAYLNFHASQFLFYQI